MKSEDLIRLKELYENHKEWLWNYAASRTDPSMAEDMVSDTFLRIIPHLEKLSGQEKEIRGYLKKTLLSCIVDFYRQKQNLEIPRENDWIIGVLDQTKEQELDPFHILQEQEEKNWLWLEVQRQLRPEAGQMLRSYYSEGESYREIAENTGKTLSNVGLTIHRSKKKLKKELKPW